jgi:hypothetical protein
MEIRELGVHELDDSGYMLVMDSCWSMYRGPWEFSFCNSNPVAFDENL